MISIYILSNYVNDVVMQNFAILMNKSSSFCEVCFDPKAGWKLKGLWSYYYEANSHKILELMMTTFICIFYVISGFFVFEIFFVWIF